MNIKLPKNFIGDGRLLISDDENAKWITNGHWLIQRRLLADAELLTSCAVARATWPKATVDHIPESSILRVLEGGTEKELVEYHQTRWVRASYANGDAYLFMTSDEQSIAWYDRRYIDRFDLDVIYAPANNGDSFSYDAAVNAPNPADVAIVIMPRREDDLPRWMKEVR